MKVCHLTSAHSQQDIRIFYKECISLYNNGFETYQISRGNSGEMKGVKLIGVGELPSNRLKRMIQTARKVYKEALLLDADIYHFHDPELLPYGLKLKKKGKTVIFDSHEDVAAQIMDKPWIPKLCRKPIAGIYKAYETVVVSKLDAVVAATSHIAETFQNRANKVIVINNYPKLDDIVFQTKAFRYRSKVIAYAGGLSEVRGEKVLVNAMQYVQGTLTIANDHPVSMEGNINYIGKKDRAGVNELYSDSRVGIVIYQPADNHYDSQPIKMFEFMAAGLPVVASNFPLWKRIVEGNKCGICVNPCDYKEVAKACNELLDSPTMAEKMGKNGRKAVENKYSWMSEERKLIDLYHQLESKMER